MPVAGLVRLRRHLLGRQAAHGTVVPATRAYPWSGTPDNELNWTNPDLDAGARINVAPPHREAPDLTASLEDPSVKYNNIPAMFAAFIGDAVTPTGTTAKTWAFDLDATAIGQPDRFTYQFGDDVDGIGEAFSDWFQLGDGILEELAITGPDDGRGPLTASLSWIFGSIRLTGSTDSPAVGTVPTGGATGLMPSTTDNIIYLKDGAIYISSSYYDLAGSQVSNALHAFTLTLTQEIDKKAWANGEQSWDVDDYAGGPVTITLECTFSKTADTVGVGSESDAWMSDNAVNRYVRMVFESTDDAEYGVPYSWEFTMPMRYITRVEGEVGGNTVVILTGEAFYDNDEFGGAFTTEVVNTLASL